MGEAAATLTSHGGRLISFALFFALYASHDFSPPFLIWELRDWSQF
jgi:hypothetical protein